MVDADTFLVLETNVPAFTADEFRGEFEQGRIFGEAGHELAENGSRL